MRPDDAGLPEIADLIKIDDDAAGIRLADRSTRFVAAIVDSIIALAYGFPLLLPMLVATSKGSDSVVLAVGRRRRPHVDRFLLVHGYLLRKNGQTVGKKLMGIRITDLHGNVPRFGTVILLRYFPIWFVSLIPVAGNFLLTDRCFLYLSKRPPLHS